MPTETPAAGAAGYEPTIQIPAWGQPRGPAEQRLAARTRRVLAQGVYGDMYALARELTEDAPTAYDAVTRVERHLRENYAYDPNVPDHSYPLASFLFDDLSGYCQQFAGAMALMLRMVGIPARVVGGFAPGRYNPDDNAYEVSDTDAHSWVEVYFPRIGWVTFDPTPAAAPAAAQLREDGGPVTPQDRPGILQGEELLGQGTESKLRGADPKTPAAEGSDDQGGSPFGTLVGLAVAGAVAVFAVGYVRRRARLRGPRAAELQAREFVTALARLGWDLPAGTTLHAIERRFAATGRGPIASYARALARYRYEPGPARRPGAPQRRSLRRAVGRGGLGRRWLAWRALPPGGPRP
jgi:hypothetical protein